MLLRAVLAGLLICASSVLADTTPPSTTNNNDSCDISVQPAATLLLPYFEVDTAAPVGTGTTTLFTVTNASRYPQIAHVTVWTDWAFPVLNFNLFLTGYDVQGINLYDVIVRGIIAPTSVNTTPGTPQNGFVGAGSVPLGSTANPNFLLAGNGDVRLSCNQLPGTITADLQTAVKNALTRGNGYASCGSAQIGFNHGQFARGYVTIDVVSYCTNQFPSDVGGTYFAGPTAAILYDNVLFGDYQQIGPTPIGSGVASTYDAGGNAMVHIRAVPEGGFSGVTGGVPIATNLPFTFYDRYTPDGARTADRRQPLPSSWAARYIQGGNGGFATDFKIWREGVTRGPLDCLAGGAQLNSGILVSDIVRFDEHENSFGTTTSNCVSACVPPVLSLPAASRLSTTSSVYPTLTGFDVGGWIYLNLTSAALPGYPSLCIAALSAQRAGFGTCGAPLGASGSRTTSQNWVITSMFGAVGANRLSVDFDGVQLGNGCTPAAVPITPISPAAQRNGLVCPPNAPASSCAPNAVRPPVNP